MRKPLGRTDLEKIVDGLGLGIDVKIMDLVVAVNQYITTTASCEGHYDHGLKVPWIDVYNKEDNFSDLGKILESWNRNSKIPWVLYRYTRPEAKYTVERDAAKIAQNYKEDGVTMEYARRACEDSLHTRRLAPMHRNNWPLEQDRDMAGYLEGNATGLILEETQEEAGKLAKFLIERSASC
jgi:hypothetical protein